jgi:hypothetical protein
MAKPTSKPGAKPTTHVNKAPTAKEIKAAEQAATDRMTRLGLIHKILTAEGRERYDHFLDNGFPKWRGTGYYYARFRPGLGSVLLGLFVFTGGLAHYVVLILGYKRQRDFVDRYIRQARKLAWGDENTALGSIPGLTDIANNATPVDSDDEQPVNEPVNRRERRLQEKEAKRKNKDKSLKPSRANGHKRSGTTTPIEPTESGTATPVPGPRKRVEAENGKILVVDKEGNVFLEEVDEETEESQLFLLDPDEIEKPTFKQTILYRLPAWVFGLAKERLGGKGEVEQPSEYVTVTSPITEIKAGESGVIEAKLPSAARQRKKRSKPKQ